MVAPSIVVAEFGSVVTGVVRTAPLELAGIVETVPLGLAKTEETASLGLAGIVIMLVLL